VERRAAFRRRARKILVFQLDEQLAGADTRAALHVGFFQRGRDLRNDGGLLARIEHAIRANGPLNLRDEHRRDIDGHDRCRLFFLLGAAGEGREQRNDEQVVSGSSRTDASHQKFPVNVCSSATATRYRASASSAALRARTAVFCASTISSAVDSPA